MNRTINAYQRLAIRLGIAAFRQTFMEIAGQDHQIVAEGLPLLIISALGDVLRVEFMYGSR